MSWLDTSWAACELHLCCLLGEVHSVSRPHIMTLHLIYGFKRWQLNFFILKLTSAFYLTASPITVAYTNTKLVVAKWLFYTPSILCILLAGNLRLHNLSLITRVTLRQEHHILPLLPFSSNSAQLIGCFVFVFVCFSKKNSPFLLE